MFVFFSSLVTLCSILMNNSHSSDHLFYNETTKTFEIKNSNIEQSEIEKSWDILKNDIKNNLNENEKIKKFSIEDGFIKDLYYLKNKNKNLKVISYEMLRQWSEKTQTPIFEVSKINGREFSSNNLPKQIKKKLILEAQRARTFAYAPYSEFHVGSAILTKDGKIYSGCNFENAAYGNTICAERAAIAKAVTSENRGVSFQNKANIVAIAVVIRGGAGSPCGNCRQALYEFNPNMLVIMSDIDGESVIEKNLQELLPMGFGPSNLDNAIVK